ncbi:hypothetical protein LINPERHAP2_LOCUS21270 [Linum perenne]
MSFFTSGSKTRNSKHTKRVMHKLKKPVEEDLFVYEASVVNCWCDLRATISVRPSDMERYFGCPREREENGCGYYEKLEVQEAVDTVIKEKDRIIRAKDEQLVRTNREKDDIVGEKDNIIRDLREEISWLHVSINRLLREGPPSPPPGLRPYN